MENRNALLLIVLSLILSSCIGFKGEKVELNYKEGYVKVLSNDYIIDSMVVNNHTKKHFIIGLLDKRKGENILYFKKKNLDYRIYIDSLEYYCSKRHNVESPELEIFIRKKGYLGKDEAITNIQYFNYNKIPCNSVEIDTIKAVSPYK